MGFVIYFTDIPEMWQLCHALSIFHLQKTRYIKPFHPCLYLLHIINIKRDRILFCSAGAQGVSYVRAQG